MAMSKKLKKCSHGLWDDMKVFFRAVKINYSLDPRFFWMQVINVVSDRVRPFVNSFFTALVIDGIYRGESTKNLIIYAIIVVVSNMIINLLVLFTANRRYIRKSMWDKVMAIFFNKSAEKMDYHYFEDIRVKDARRKIDWDIHQGVGISNYSTWQNLVGAVTTLLTSIVILFTFFSSQTKESHSGILYFVNTVWAPLMFMFILIVAFVYSDWYEKSRNKIYREVNSFWAETWRLASKVGGYPTDTKLSMEMNIYNLDSIIHDSIEAAVSKSTIFQKKINYRMAKREFCNILFNFAIKFIACCFVGLKALSGAFGLGTFVFYLTTVLQLSNAVSSFGWAFGTVRGVRKILDEEFEYLDIKNNMLSGKCMPDLYDERHTIEFRNVSFRYPECQNYALKNVNLKIEFGEKIAIVGMNGSGKTTFIKLLCRLYDPQCGEILLDGKNIREYDYKEYMKLFSIVFQDFKLFAFPLAENVAIGKKFDRQKVEKCLETAGFAERLHTMPEGIDTCLYKNFDANGVEISGGEAQKIVFARALYKDAAFIVLDEPTAALDPFSEAEVYSCFDGVAKGKTAVYISHRLSSCKFCTKIIVFDNGSIIQTGTHSELLKNERGKYSELWRAQAQYYKMNDENILTGS